MLLVLIFCSILVRVCRAVSFSVVSGNVQQNAPKRIGVDIGLCFACISVGPMLLIIIKMHSRHRLKYATLLLRISCDGVAQVCDYFSRNITNQAVRVLYMLTQSGACILMAG